MISFIIPCYNIPVDMLRECIDSILALSLKEDERAIWLVVLYLIDEALDDGKAVTQPDRLAAVDGLGRGA